jgi:hypothetical protein
MVDKCNNAHPSCNEPRTQVGGKGRGRAGITEATLRNRISKILYTIPQTNRTK